MHRRINAATVKSAQRLLADDTPKIFPEAYVTIPSSRSSSLLPGHYEVVNVFVHALRKIDGTGLNKEYATWNVMSARLNYNSTRMTLSESRVL